MAMLVWFCMGPLRVRMSMVLLTVAGFAVPWSIWYACCSVCVCVCDEVV